MANPNHVALVKQGAAAIEAWRKAHPNERLDLSRADLRSANLSHSNLSEADLRGCNLSDGNLFGAILSDADLLYGDLKGANLSDAGMIRANLSNANLSGVNLSGARLTHTDMSFSDLSSADLSHAWLSIVNLFVTRLSNANLSHSSFYHCSLADCDLSGVKGLSTVYHEAPSSIGVDTLGYTFLGAGKLWTSDLRKFFLGAGVPKELLDGLPKLLADVKYRSAFISYGQPDVALAERLYKDFQARGVPSWLYKLDKTPGERTQHEIKQQLRGADKVVLLCSVQSLIREGVVKELEETIDDDPDKIIPISLDTVWFQPGFRVMIGSRDLGPWLRDRNYADFSDQNNPKAYEQELAKLLNTLRRPEAKLS